MEAVSGDDTGRAGDDTLLVDCVRSVLSRAGKGDWHEVGGGVLLDSVMDFYLGGTGSLGSG